MMRSVIVVSVIMAAAFAIVVTEIMQFLDVVVIAFAEVIPNRCL